MNVEASADTAVLASAILTLLAIASKLVTANLVTRSKRIYTQLDSRRRDIAARLKEAQLKRTSARGTLEFWERRRKETHQRVQDVTRDLEAYENQYGPVEALADPPEGEALADPPEGEALAGEGAAAQAGGPNGPSPEGPGPEADTGAADRPAAAQAQSRGPATDAASAAS